MYRIGEVAERLGVGTHVVRHWESPMLSGTRDASGHRRYTERDVELLQRVQVYVQRRGFTVDGAWDAVADDLLQGQLQSDTRQQLRARLQGLLHRSLRIAGESAGRPLLSVTVDRLQPGTEAEPQPIVLDSSEHALHRAIQEILARESAEASALWPQQRSSIRNPDSVALRCATAWLRRNGGGLGVFVHRGGPASRQGLQATWPVILVPGPRLRELLPCFETPDTHDDAAPEPWIADSPARILLALPHTVGFRVGSGAAGGGSRHPASAGTGA